MTASIKDNIFGGMNYLKRRFSSDDLYSERHSDDQDIQRLSINPHSVQGSPSGHSAGSSAGFQAQVRANIPSAPSFPSFSSVQGMTKNFLSSAAASITQATQRVVINKERCKVLLVIDEKHTDWARYFRGRKIFGDWDLRVEQAEFKEISIAAFSDSGAVVEVQVMKNGQKIIQSFRPDLVLVRQHARHATDNWKHVLLALQYGNVPSVNSLHSVYNFLDKPWVFSQLIQIQRRLGKERFPVIEQSFYPNHHEMMSNLWMVLPKLPVVVKIGHGHSGVGKVRVEDHYGFQDLASVMAVTDCYATTEPFIQAECDIYVQKIGAHYNTYMRKAMSGNWKANVGTATLEQITTTERYRLWVDECSEIFGGLDILSVKAVRATDGREFIIEVCDSTMTLCGSDDNALVADLVLSRVESLCRPSAWAQDSPRGSQLNPSQSPRNSASSINNTPHRQPTQQQQQQQQQHHQQMQQHQQFQQHHQQQQQYQQMQQHPSQQRPSQQQQQQYQQNQYQQQQQQQQQQHQAYNSVRQQESRNPQPGGPMPGMSRPGAPRPLARVEGSHGPSGAPASPRTIEAIARDLEGGEEGEDTMNNLRKTFAGIFNNAN